MQIDARGLRCPKPVMLAEEAASAIGEGVIELLVDHEASVKNLKKFASKNSLYYEAEKLKDHWKVKLVKGYPCEVPEEKPKENETGAFLVVGTDSMGKEEEIGRVLMKAFFETMKVTREIPGTIFFLNSGVKLTTSDEELVLLLKDIEAMGAEIFSCGTCLKHFGLEGSLKVGMRGTTDKLLEAITGREKTVWI